MAAPMQFASLVDSLPNSLNKSGILNEIRTLVTSMTLSDIRGIVPNCSFGLIFECLETTDRDELAVCCGVLESLLAVVEPVTLLTQYNSELTAGLQHPSEDVQKLALKQVQRIGGQQLGCHGELLRQIARLIAEDNLSVSEQSRRILSTLGSSCEGLDALFAGDMQSTLQDAMQQGDTQRFRVYQVIVDVSVESVTGLQRAASAGYLQKLFNEVHRDDILLQLNALEVLKDLAMCEHGLVYLDNQGVISRLESMLNEVQGGDPMMAFLLPGLVKFFGNVAFVHPKEICSRFKGFATLLFQLTQHSDISLQCIAIETIGLISKTAEGKLALQKQGDCMTRACSQMGLVMQSGAVSELRVRVLSALTSMMALPVCDQTEELLSLTSSWFRSCHARPMQAVMTLASQPWPELRCGALGLFKSIAGSPWGQRMMNAHAGFNEYLLDRNTEKSAEGKEAKYDIVRTLGDSPTSLDIFGKPYHMRLQQYTREGAYYKRVEAAVAYEEAS